MKSKTTAGILAIFLGGLGIHKFYLGQTVAGIFYILFCWTWIPSIIGIIEGISYLTHSDEWRNEKYNKEGVKDNLNKKYDELLKLDELKEKGHITEEEYKEKVKEVKEQIKEQEETSKRVKENMKKSFEKDMKRIGNIWKIIGGIAILCILFALLGGLAMYFNQKNDVVDNTQVTTKTYKEEVPIITDEIIEEEEIPILSIDDDDEY